MFYYQFVKLCNGINKSPSAVAEEIGLKRSVVTAWKNGRKPRLATSQKVASYFGVPLSELIGHDPAEDKSVDDQIKFALFGTAEVTDETFAEVKRFAQFALERERERK